MNVAIIPARGGSRRIPGKNKKDFHGRPIICYSIDAAKESGLFHDVIVSTDDDDIKEIALNMGVGVQERVPDMARDEVGTQEVAGHALSMLRFAGSDPQYACVIYATAPMISVGDLVYGLQLLEAGDFHYVYSVGPMMADAGQWYWGKTLSFVRGVSLSHEKTSKVKISNRRVCDINNPIDWKRAEIMYARLTK